jgi:hypothetical protein
LPVSARTPKARRNFAAGTFSVRFIISFSFLQNKRSQQGCAYMSLYRYSSALPDFEDAFLCIAVEVGLEKRRYLLFASSAQQKAKEL